MSIEETLQPNSIEAEQAVIGGLLVNKVDSEGIEEIFELLKPEDFFRADHEKIYTAINTLYNKREQTDVLTVGEHLKRLKQDKDIGGIAYLGELAANAPVSQSSLSYAKVIHERALHRSLITVGEKISRLGLDPQDRENANLLDDAEKILFELSQKNINQKTFSGVREILDGIASKIDQLSNLNSYITGFPTGYTHLDDLTGGLQRGDLIIVAGRPSMGKTTLALNIAEHISSHGGDYVHVSKHKESPCIVGIFSMEMGEDQLMMRLISAKASVPLKNIRSGNVDAHEWESLINAMSRLTNLESIYIDDSSGISVHTLRGRARRLKKDFPTLSLIVVDYLQLLKLDRRVDNRTAEMTEISRILKEMARELDIPVVVLSQLNRTVESRKEHRPMMSDLRESGSIEQDADIICFIHRPEIYDRENVNLKGKSTIHIAKHRNGEIGDINLLFEGQYSRFSNPLINQQADEDLAISVE